MKYINFAAHGIICFPDTIYHLEMARVIGGRILSAGFVEFDNPHCSGKSESLRMKSSPRDTKILKKQVKESL